MITVRPVHGPADLETVRELCWDYRAFLETHDPDAGPAAMNAYPEDAYRDLMDNLATVHARPEGIILGAFGGDRMIGCGMSYRIEDGVTEIKRLYVRAADRSTGAGTALMDALLAQAREDGFHTVRLDTSKALLAACRLYARLGFTERPPYYDVQADIAPFLRWFELRLDVPG